MVDGGVLKTTKQVEAVKASVLTMDKETIINVRILRQ